jgi:hypothetical protein
MDPITMGASTKALTVLLTNESTKAFTEASTKALMGTATKVFTKHKNH